MISNDGLADKVEAVSRGLELHEAKCFEQAKAVTLSLEILNAGHATIVAKLDSLNRTGWRMVGTVAMTFSVPLLSLLAWFFTQVWPVMGHVATTIDVSAATHDRYTAQDAARDRAAEDARYAALLAAVQQTRHRR